MLAIQHEKTAIVCHSIGSKTYATCVERAGPSGGRASAHRHKDIRLNLRQDPADTAGTSDARAWTQKLLRFREPSRLRSTFELIVTFGPLAALWALMWLSYSFGFWWLTLLLALPAAAFLVRLFMIQHDCGHGAFFRHRLTNDWIGRVIGVLTFTPYDFWRRTHAIHHATSGNLERRGIGDIATLTVKEYLALSRWGRLQISAVSPSAGDVRRRPGLSVHRAASPAGRPHARRLCAMAEHAGHQCGDRAGRRPADLADRARRLRAGPSADHAACRRHGRLAVLRAASVRGHGVGA